MRAVQTWWRPTGGLARTLTWVFGAQAGLLLVSVFADDETTYLNRLHHAFQALQQGNDKLAQQRFDHIGNGPEWFQLASFVSTVGLVLIIIWQWRSAKNAEALGRTGARFTPGWSIAGWLIPFANLVIPYLIMQDLWRASDPQAEPGIGWRRLKGAPLVAQWWIAYIVSFVAVPAVMAAVIFGATTAGSVGWALKAGRLLGAGAAVLAIFVIREITSRQEQQQATTPAPLVPSRAPAPVAPTSQTALPAPGAALPPPGWYIDPRGRFDWRYWSGNSWSEWVATDGETSIDPV
jgi:hypothetical protein